MNVETELTRLTKENDDYRQIIETQQNTIRRLIDFYILGQPVNETKNGQQYMLSVFLIS